VYSVHIAKYASKSRVFTMAFLLFVMVFNTTRAAPIALDLSVADWQFTESDTANGSPDIGARSDVTLSLTQAAESLRPSRFGVREFSVGKWAGIFSRTFDKPLGADTSGVEIAFDWFVDTLKYTRWPPGARGTPRSYDMFGIKVLNGLGVEVDDFSIALNCRDDCGYAVTSTSGAWTFTPGTQIGYDILLDASIASGDLVNFFDDGPITVEFQFKEFSGLNQSQYYSDFFTFQGINDFDPLVTGLVTPIIRNGGTRVTEPSTWLLILLYGLFGLRGKVFRRLFQRPPLKSICAYMLSWRRPLTTRN